MGGECQPFTTKELRARNEIRDGELQVFGLSGKENPHRGTGTESAFYLDPAAMSFHHVFDDGEAEAGAAFLA